MCADPWVGQPASGGTNKGVIVQVVTWRSGQMNAYIFGYLPGRNATTMRWNCTTPEICGASSQGLAGVGGFAAGFNMREHIARCTFGGPKYFEPPESRFRIHFGSGAVLPSRTSKPMPLCKTTSRSAMQRDGKSLPIPGRIVTTLSWTMLTTRNS